MASTYRTIEELYRTTLVALSESPEAWKAFLESAGRNYKLPFPEQALVHAQRPDATAVLELERWDALFGRRVKRGSVGIAVFGAPGTGRLRYYFDVSDTAPGRAARPLPLWAGGPEQEAAIVGALHESFGADARKGTIEAIAEAASAAVRENAESAVAAIGEARGGSGLERLEAPEAGGSASGARGGICRLRGGVALRHRRRRAHHAARGGRPADVRHGPGDERARLPHGKRRRSRPARDSPRDAGKSPGSIPSHVCALGRRRP